MAEKLTFEQVAHVARLARLAVPQEVLEVYREQLAAVLDHIEKLKEIDIDDVEPLAHPRDLANRLAADEIAKPLPLDALMQNAPAAQDRFLAVPKVLIDREGGDDER